MPEAQAITNGVVLDFLHNGGFQQISRSGLQSKLLKAELYEGLYYRGLLYGFLSGIPGV